MRRLTVFGNIVVEGVAADEVVTISTSDGIAVWNGKGSARVAAERGVYIVRAANRTAKVIVR